MKIPFRGNTARFSGQSSAQLVSVRDAVSKNLPEAMRQYFGADFPRGHCLLCVYIGNLGIPFVDIQKYTITTFDKLRASTGQTFEIDAPEGSGIAQQPAEPEPTPQQTLEL